MCFAVKAPWRRRWRWRQGGIQKMLKTFLAAVLLSAMVERCFVSRMRDFFLAVPAQDTSGQKALKGFTRLRIHTCLYLS